MIVYKQPRVTVVGFPQFVEPEHLRIEQKGEATNAERLSEYAGRVCYMSQANPAGRTTAEYLANIKQQAHGSVFEHATISVLAEGISRSLTHEWVRHRAGWAYSQLSQRYVDESDCAVVMPPAIQAGSVELQGAWVRSMLTSLAEYGTLSNILFEQYADDPDKVSRRKRAREAARSVLPNATETKMVATANVRAWRHFLEMRGSSGADAEIRQLARAVYEALLPVCPSMLSDYVWDADGCIVVAHRKV